MTDTSPRFFVARKDVESMRRQVYHDIGIRAKRMLGLTFCVLGKWTDIIDVHGANKRQSANAEPRPP
jgi:hypothetical protein